MKPAAIKDFACLQFHAGVGTDRRLTIHREQVCSQLLGHRMELGEDAEALVHEGADFLGLEEGGVAKKEEGVFGGLGGEAGVLLEIVEDAAGE